MIDRNQIPPSWEVVKLGEVCEIVTGTTPSKADSSNYGNDIPFIKPPQLIDRPIFNTDEKLSYKGAKQARVIPPNTVLVTCIGNLGRTGIIKIESAFNQQLNAVLENEVIAGKYIFYQAQSPNFKLQLENLSAATTVAIVNKGKFSTIEIPLPPLPEQHRIVSKIEELFSELDKGIESLKTAQQQLKIYRQAMLKWAFEGRLTHEDVKDGELPEGWKWVKIAEVAESMKNGLYKPADVYSENGIACLRMYNINLGKIVWFDIKRMNLSKEDIEEYKLKEGDLLVNRVNSRELVGKTAVIRKYNEPIVYESKNIRLRVKSTINSEYLNYWFLLSANKYFNSNAQQTVGMASINQMQLSNFEFPLSPFHEQKQIVSEIETRLSVCDKLGETITTALQQSEALRQSILKKAFEGKLVEQNSNDEPASKLLESIKAEREKDEVLKKKSRRDEMIIGKKPYHNIQPRRGEIQ